MPANTASTKILRARQLFLNQEAFSKRPFIKNGIKRKSAKSPGIRYTKAALHDTSSCVHRRNQADFDGLGTFQASAASSRGARQKNAPTHNIMVKTAAEIIILLKKYGFERTASSFFTDTAAPPFHALS